jgi:hypothetical protein
MCRRPLGTIIEKLNIKKLRNYNVSRKPLCGFAQQLLLKIKLKTELKYDYGIKGLIRQKLSLYYTNTSIGLNFQQYCVMKMAG